MGIAQLGIERSPYVIELEGSLDYKRLFPETGSHPFQCLVFILLHGFVKGYQGFNGRQVFRDDKGERLCRIEHHKHHSYDKISFHIRSD